MSHYTDFKISAAFYLCLLGALTPSASSSQPVSNATLRASIKPNPIVANFSDSKASGVLVLENLDGLAAKFDFNAHPLTLRGGSGAALLQFEGDPAAPASPGDFHSGDQSFRFSISGLTSAGTYEGSVDVRKGPAGALVNVPVIVLKQPYVFEPVISGDNLVDGVLTLKPTSPTDTNFWFTITNPKGGPDLSLKILWPIALTGRGNPVGVDLSASDRQTISLPAGASRAISLHLKEMKADGAVAGKVLIEDTADGGGQKSFQIAVQPAFVAFSDNFLIAGLVFLGTLLSLLVGTVVPMLMARQQLWAKLTLLAANVDAAADRGGSTQLALRVQLSRLDYLAHRVRWFTPGASDALANLMKDVGDLDTRVNTVARANELRRIALDSGTIPVSVVPRLGRSLDSVVKLALSGSLGDAQGALGKAQSLMDDASLADSVRQSLSRSVAGLPDPADFADKGVDAGMLLRFKQLKALKIEELDASALNRNDQECFAATLYFVKYRSLFVTAQSPETDYASYEQELLGYLRRGLSGLWNANDLMRSLELGVLPPISGILSDPESIVIVATPAEPVFFEKVLLSVRFARQEINDSPLVTSIPVQWKFDDALADARGLRCFHYFRPKNWEEGWKKGSVTRTVTVTVGGQERKFDLRVRGTNIWSRLAARSEFMTTATVFVGAIALALITHQADIHHLDSVQDFVNPFLWGFGLDQMKGLVGKR